MRKISKLINATNLPIIKQKIGFIFKNMTSCCAIGKLKIPQQKLAFLCF